MKSAVQEQLHTATITEVKPLAAEVISVTFSVAPGMTLHHGQVVFIKEQQQCPHTVSVTPAGLYSIILHQEDTAAACIKAGEELQLHACTGPIPFDEQSTHHFFFGNEKAAGLFRSYKEMAEARDHEYFGVTELQQHNADCLTALKLMLENVAATPDTPAANAIQWMEEMHPLCWNTWKDATFYLAGNSESTGAFKRYLLQKGVPVKNIRC